MLIICLTQVRGLPCSEVFISAGPPSFVSVSKRDVTQEIETGSEGVQGGLCNGSA